MVRAKKYRKQQQKILRWYRVHKRDLPWRRTQDSYAIFVSEIMLQQTQVDRVVPKYLAWLQLFPTVFALANATPAAVLRAWSGLGYNRRALFLQRAARMIVEEGWPKTVEAMCRLPGVGAYTAGAVLSFAFGQRTLAFDVNVQRVIRRAFLGVGPKRKAHDIQTILAVAECLLPRDASTWQQAVMDLGATACVARPRCETCPLRITCPSAQAFLAGWREVGGKKQSERFVDSARFVRGHIVKQLTVHTARTERELATALRERGISEERLALALRALEREGFVSRSGRVYALPSA